MVVRYSPSSEYLPTRSYTFPSEGGGGGEVLIEMEDGQIVKQPECGERQNIAVNMMIIISILVDIYLLGVYYYWWEWGFLPISLYVSMSLHKEWQFFLLPPWHHYLRRLLYRKFQNAFPILLFSFPI